MEQAKPEDSLMLIVNAGSSSLKMALYARPLQNQPVVMATIDRLGEQGSRWSIASDSFTEAPPAPNTILSHSDALNTFFDWMNDNALLRRVCVAGHRVVHGGALYAQPTWITRSVLDDLKRLVPMDPGHLPQAISCIQVVARRSLRLPQIACFDTAFHQTMPRRAKALPLPRRFASQGVVRYGFHGLSYESILHELAVSGLDQRGKRTIIAHLGNGSSMVALRDGRSVDTTMGMTPTGGLMMGTRSGDIDPGALLFLAKRFNLTSDQLDAMVNTESGLLGVSNLSGDLRDLQEASGNEHAQEAIDLYCYLARKQLGGLIAVLGGLDYLVFTGGIGQHSAQVRLGICSGLEELGIRLDGSLNSANDRRISDKHGRTHVLVLPTNEDLMIARHTDRLAGERDPL